MLVTASNAAGSLTAESETTGVVAPSPPANVTPPSIIGDPYLGVDLTVEDGQWSGTEPSYTYRWQRCRNGICTDIGEESDYTVSRGDLGSNLVVIVTATNGAGSATAASAPTRRVSRRPVCIVPRLMGKRLAGARRSIRAAHCAPGRVRRVASRKARGRVIGQGLKPGLHRPAGTKVNLVVSRGRR